MVWHQQAGISPRPSSPSLSASSLPNTKVQQVAVPKHRLECRNRMTARQKIITSGRVVSLGLEFCDQFLHLGDLAFLGFDDAVGKITYTGVGNLGP